jgi:hypothetical protein
MFSGCCAVAMNPRFAHGKRSINGADPLRRSVRRNEPEPSRGTIFGDLQQIIVRIKRKLGRFINAWASFQKQLQYARPISSVNATS